jgi:hypothetical protein
MLQQINDTSSHLCAFQPDKLIARVVPVRDKYSLSMDYKRLAFWKSVKTSLCFDSGNKIVLLQNIKTILFGFAGGGKVS